MSNYENDLARWLRDADSRDRDTDRRHKELLEAHRRGYDQLTRAITDGFKILADTIADAGRR